VPDGNTTAVVLGNYATLDLGGFSISGTTIAGSFVEDMLIAENSNRGIIADNGRCWIVRNSRVLRNGVYGIDLAISGAYALITGNVIEGTSAVCP
jgi:hypothetical protein